MTAKQYLNELRRALVFRCSRTEITNILAEYQLFFTEGIMDGKTEDSLCQSFGSPRVLARNLAERKQPRLLIKAILGWSAYFVLFLVLWNTLYAFPLLRTGVLWIMLWFLLGGGLYTLSPYTIINDRYRSMIPLHGFTLFVMLVAAIYHLVHIILFPSGIVPNSQVLKAMIFVPIGLFALLMLIGIYGFFWIHPKYYSLICHAGGGLCSILYIRDFLWKINTPDILVLTFVQCFIPYIVGVVIAVGFSIFIGGILRKEAKVV